MKIRIKTYNGEMSDPNITAAEHAYWEGIASRQAEIDSLNKNIEALHVENERIQKQYQMMFECVQGRQQTINELQTDVEGLQNDLIKAAEGQMKLFEHNNELQKQINEALKVFKSDLSPIGKFNTIHNILKGKEND